MTDVTISGDVAIRSDNAPPPEPSVEMPLPSDIRASDSAFSPEQLGEITEHTADHRVSEKDWVDNSLGELKQKRERYGDGLEGTPPIVEVKAARQNEPYKLREAQRESSEGTRLYSATAALANARAIVGNTTPVTDEEVRQHDRNWEELQKTGLAHKPGEIPWNNVGLIRDDGREIPKLRDDQRI